MSLHKINKHYRYIAIPSDSKDLPWWQLLQQLKSFTVSVPRCIQVAYNYVRWGQWHYYFSYYSTSDVQRDVFCEPHRRRIFFDPVSLCLEIAAVQVNDMKLWDCWTTSCDFMGRVHQPLPFAGLRRHWKKIFLINIIMPRVVHTYMCVPIPTCMYPYLHVCNHTYMYVTILTCMYPYLLSCPKTHIHGCIFTCIRERNCLFPIRFEDHLTKW